MRRLFLAVCLSCFAVSCAGEVGSPVGKDSGASVDRGPDGGDGGATDLCGPGDPQCRDSQALTCGGDKKPCTPPANTCISTKTLRRWDPLSGECVNGACVYQYSDMECANGCVNGQCQGDPCANVTCKTPSAATCVDAKTLRTFAKVGTCTNGTCSYPHTDKTCSYGCANATCVAAPTPTCSDGKKNGNETDIDCGGSCSPCSAGKTCSVHKDCLHQICISSTCVTDPLARAFSGQALFVKDKTGLGSAFNMHFVSMTLVGSKIYSFHITSKPIAGTWRWWTSLATSTDAVNFSSQGTVLDIGGSWEDVFKGTDPLLSHLTGEADGDGWSATPSKHAANFLIYGPYQVFKQSIAKVASFRLMVGSNSGIDAAARLEVYDATADKVLAAQTLAKNQFSAANTLQIFTLPFAAVAGHKYEYRVYWYKTTYVKVAAVGIATGKAPWWDNRLSSFPGVLKLNASWYLVYEGSGTEPGFNGDIGLVTSSSPTSFRRSRVGPFLKHNTSGWEKVNIGTPSLYHEGGTIYLFYHGFDGVDCRVGLATFTPGGTPVKYSGNPVLNTSSSGWDSGTIGKRSRIFKEGNYYYMAYEGSTDQPYDKANWSSGLARSSNLFAWTKSGANPVVPVVSGGFGNDGPELLYWNGRYYLYVRAGGATDRYVLKGK